MLQTHLTMRRKADSYTCYVLILELLLLNCYFFNVFFFCEIVTVGPLEEHIIVYTIMHQHVVL